MLLIHGIRTYAKWQSLTEKVIKDNDSSVYVHPIKYERHDLLRFLFWYRSGPIERVLRELRGVRADNQGAAISAVAHSFGTYILMSILHNEPDVNLHRVILCGSVIPRNFYWQNLARFPSGGIINEVGTRDYLPVMAKLFSKGYGSSGTFGFGSTKVKDRHHDLGHSDFFNESFINKYWISFILGGVIIDSKWGSDRPDEPWWIAFMDTPWLARPLFIFILLLLVSWIIYCLI